MGILLTVFAKSERTFGHLAHSVHYSKSIKTIYHEISMKGFREGNPKYKKTFTDLYTVRLDSSTYTSTF